MCSIGNLSSQLSMAHVDCTFATDRYELEQNAKPWSELFEQLGPSLKSSLSPSPDGETKTRPLYQKARAINNHDGKNNNSSTALTKQETTTFSKTANTYVRSIFPLTQHT